jgi:hypothetical protein
MFGILGDMILGIGFEQRPTSFGALSVREATVGDAGKDLRKAPEVDAGKIL